MTRRAGFVVLAGMLAWTVLAENAAGARVDICYSEVAAPDAAPPTSATLFDCPRAGAKTVPQLAAAGWRVLRMTPVSVVSGGFGVRQQLLIGDDTLFASGFDS